MGQLGQRNVTCATIFIPLFFIVDSSCFLSQIVDHSKTFQLPEAMKVVDALLRSAQDIVLDASIDMMSVAQVRKSENVIIQKFSSCFLAASRKFCLKAISR